ncbi:putative ribonuclease H-like domain-containing protein [Tanacetum coccineum]
MYVLLTLTGLFHPQTVDLSTLGLEEFPPGPEFEGYRPKISKSVSEDISNEVMKSPDALLVEELVSNVKVIHKYKIKAMLTRGCSRHMTGNMSYLSDLKHLMEDMLHLGEEPKEEELLVNELLKMVSLILRMCTLSRFLLKVPRKIQYVRADLEDIVPKESLTCLVAKATLDELMLWHRRLGHVNFKTINKLVKDNLVRGLPSKRFENDQTCVACLKGKQHKASSILILVPAILVPSSSTFPYKVSHIVTVETLHL